MMVKQQRCFLCAAPVPDEKLPQLKYMFFTQLLENIILF